MDPEGQQLNTQMETHSSVFNWLPKNLQRYSWKKRKMKLIEPNALQWCIGGYSLFHGEAFPTKAFPVFSTLKKNSAAIVKSVSQDRKKRIFPMKNLLHYVSCWSVAGGPTDPYFAAILSVGHSFSINPAKNRGRRAICWASHRGLVTLKIQKTVEILIKKEVLT